MPSKLKTPIALVGKGISNMAVNELLYNLKYSADDIIFFDDKISPDHVSDPNELFAKGVQTLIVSPGYPLSKKWILEARDRGIEVTSEIDFASRFLENEKTILITGSLAKSTTTCLVEVALNALGIANYVGGNLGFPLATYVNDVLSGKRSRAAYVVLELSSFQLECAGHLKRDTAVLTYLCENHLERYTSLEHYYDTKLSIKNNLSNKMVVNADCSELLNYLKKKNLLSDSQIVLSSTKTDKYFSEEDYKNKKLVGIHNHQNMNIVANVLEAEGLWSDVARKALTNFRGLPHRMEKIDLPATQSFVAINDSKATAIESVETAYQSVLCDPQFVASKARLWLLLGGRDKKLPWHRLKSMSSYSQIQPIVFGEASKLVLEQSALSSPSFSSLKEAVEYVHENASAEDWILLSPGGSSLDEFKNFEDRGQSFKNWVKQLWT